MPYCILKYLNFTKIKSLHNVCCCIISIYNAVTFISNQFVSLFTLYTCSSICICIPHHSLTKDALLSNVFINAVDSWKFLVLIKMRCLICCWKNVRSFTFSQQTISLFLSTVCWHFNISLTSEKVNFKHVGPDVLCLLLNKSYNQLKLRNFQKFWHCRN